MAELHVAIIGGGPAGAAAALTLLKRLDIKVTVFEASPYDRPRAGEALSPGTRSLLDYLGVWDGARSAAHGLTTCASEAAWGSEHLDSFDFINTVHGSGWALDRRAFDQMLIQTAADRGADVRVDQKVAALTRDGGRWRIASGGTQTTVDVVIDATGRAAKFATAQGARRIVHDRMVGVAAYLPVRAGSEQRQVIRIEAVEDGWWYAAPVPEGRVSVVFMSDADIVHAERVSDPAVWASRLAVTRHISSMVELASREVRVFSAVSARCQSADPRLITAGDAAACYDPLSSSGIPNALASGVQAARVAADGWFGEGTLRQAYEAAITADFAHYLDTRAQYYRQEARWPEAPFWKRRRAEIRLAPTARVQRIEAGSTPHVPEQVARRMQAIADRPIELAELVRTLTAQEPALADQSVILAAQDLLQEVPLSSHRIEHPETIDAPAE